MFVSTDFIGQFETNCTGSLASKKHIFAVFIASSNQFSCVEPIVLVFSDFFQNNLCINVAFNRYFFEYRCQPLLVLFLRTLICNVSPIKKNEIQSLKIFISAEVFCRYTS
jgi:hypothetical protein